MFTTKFDDYAIAGEHISCEADGFTIRAYIEFDADSRIDDDDTHNIDQSATGCDDKQFATLLDARKAWYSNEWFYCGIVVQVSRNGIELADAGLWGIECNYPGSDNSYLLEVANQLLPEALKNAHMVMEDLLAGYKRK